MVAALGEKNMTKVEFKLNIALFLNAQSPPFSEGSGAGLNRAPYYRVGDGRVGQASVM